MIRQTVSIDETISLLNEAVALDKLAVAALLANRVPCNDGLASHPTIQVQAQYGGYGVGILGIINGLFGEDHGKGPICSIFADGQLVGFGKTP